MLQQKLQHALRRFLISKSPALELASIFILALPVALSFQQPHFVISILFCSYF